MACVGTQAGVECRRTQQQALGLAAEDVAPQRPGHQTRGQQTAQAVAEQVERPAGGVLARQVEAGGQVVQQAERLGGVAAPAAGATMAAQVRRQHVQTPAVQGAGKTLVAPRVLAQSMHQQQHRTRRAVRPPMLDGQHGIGSLQGRHGASL
jgi:hypothetical protein